MEAITTIVNACVQFPLQNLWGTGQSASADGMKWDLIEVLAFPVPNPRHKLDTKQVGEPEDRAQSLSDVAHQPVRTVPTPAAPNAGPPSVRPQAFEGRDGLGGHAPFGCWWRFIKPCVRISRESFSGVRSMSICGPKVENEIEIGDLIRPVAPPQRLALLQEEDMTLYTGLDRGET